LQTCRYLTHPTAFLAERKLRVANTSREIEVLFQQRLQASRHRLERLVIRLEAVNPRSILKRGFAWVTDIDGKVVSSAAEIEPGKHLCLRFDDGSVKVEALQESIQKGEAQK